MGVDIDVTASVRRAFEAARLGQPRDVTRVQEGVGNQVYFAGDLVVRVGTGTDGAKFPRAVAVLRAAARRLRVPELVYADPTGEVVGLPIMISQRLPGSSLASLWPSLRSTERWNALAAITSELQRLHTMDVNTVPEAGFSVPWWEERVRFIERELRRNRERESFPIVWLDRMENFVRHQRSALESSPPPGVLHGDPGSGNFLFEGGELTGVIDFDEARYGPPEEDWLQLAFASETDGADTRSLRALPGFSVAAPGTAERHAIREIENVLLLLTGTLTWKTPEEARQDAFETVAEVFEGRKIHDILARLA